MKQLTSLLLALFCFANLLAQNSPFVTESISVFKNGQAFFIKNGTLKVEDGKFILPDPAPQALFGTLWFSSPEGSLSRVTSYPDTLHEQQIGPAIAIWDLLRNNLGKPATAFLDEKGMVSGILHSVAPSHENSRGEPQYSEKSLVTWSSRQEGWATVPAGQIRYVVFGDKPNLENQTTKTTARHRFEVSFNNKKGEQPLHVMYLARNLNWSPQYLLELQDETSGTLTLQGEIANEAEDISNTVLNLVVGVPNFAYANRLAWLVDFAGTIAPPTSADMSGINVFSNALMSQRIAYAGDADFSFDPGQPEGSRNEDLFFYTLRNFSLPKGGRSIQPIFKEKVEVAHIYECRLPPNQISRPYYEQDFLFDPKINKVFHTLRLENKTKQPWTTASLLVVNEQGERRPLSQDLLTYTPVGGKTYVKLTEAVEVKVDETEREIKREKAAWTDRRGGITYDLVQIESKIKMKNFTAKKLDMRLQRTITGTLLKSSADWQREEVIDPQSLRNRKTNVVWEHSVKANGELEIVYTYEIYVPA